MTDTLPPASSHFSSKHVYRSEKMLIDALNRHDFELDRPNPQSRSTLPISPSPTPQRAHKRRHSHIPQSSRTASRPRGLLNTLSRSPSPSDDDVEDLNEHYVTPSSFLLGSAVTGLPVSSRSPATTSSHRPSIRRRGNSFKLEDEPDARQIHNVKYYRAASPTPRPPLHRAAQTEIHQSPTKTLTPHGQSLRARLERVLHQPTSPGASPPDGRRSRDSPGSASPPEHCSGESSLPGSPSVLPSRGRSDPNSASPSKTKGSVSSSSTEPLTPPPTPPATSRTPARSSTPPRGEDQFSSSHDQNRSFSRSPSHSQSKLPKSQHQQQSPPPTPFNAHAASRHCRAMEGYVSFSDIEGLGAPDDPDAVDQEPAQEHKRTGLGSLFRVWG